MLKELIKILNYSQGILCQDINDSTFISLPIWGANPRTHHNLTYMLIFIWGLCHYSVLYYIFSA